MALILVRNVEREKSWLMNLLLAPLVFDKQSRCVACRSVAGTNLCQVKYV